MKKTLVVFTLLISLFGTSLCAQSLGIDSLIFSSSFSSGDSMAANSSLFFNAAIRNHSGQMYNAPQFSLRYANDTSGTNGNTLFTLNADQYYPDSIPANDTVEVVDTLYINNGLFRSGINTVVIWPVAYSTSDFSTYDSLKLNVFVTDPLNINNTIKESAIIIYPNPFSDKIWLATKGGIALEQVRIIDALGNVVFMEKKPEKQYVETSILAQGIYFIELTYNNGLKKRIKTIKQ